jgi:photosystem II stability/assembly factor-like uncharacterized protein
MHHLIIRCCLAGLALLFAATLARAEFKDPLEVAAMRTDRTTQAPMTAVLRVGSSRLVAAGWRGVIVVSDDEGKSWKQASVPVREDLTALAFPTATHGWAAGNEGVLLETTDGGLTWAKRFDGRAAARSMVDKYAALAAKAPDDKALAAALKESNGYLAQAPSRPFLDIAFENEQTGYVVGTYGLLFRTTDAGKTWEPWLELADNPSGYNIYSIRIAGGEVFLAGELGLALRLDRAQQRFVKLSTPYEGSYFTLTGKAPTLIAAGLRGNALRSDDAGKSWQKVDFATAAPTTFSGATLMPDGRTVLVTLSGQVFVGDDGGQRFKAVPPRAPMRYSGVAPAGRDEIVVVGTQGIRIEKTK